ncbi:MAG: TIGR00159 family protein, partial [Deltaproteobacteria bacterium]|nr:TIGR00159 family protein [Deltaproteobacteria bacterium]
GANEDIRKALLDVFAGNIPDAIREKETKDTYRKNKLKEAKKTTETSNDLKPPVINTPEETNKG